MHVHLYVLLKIIIKEKNMNQVALGRDELMHSAHVLFTCAGEEKLTGIAIYVRLYKS